MVCGAPATGRRDISHGPKAKVKSIFICDNENIDTIKQIAKYELIDHDNVLQSVESLTAFVQEVYPGMLEGYKDHLSMQSDSYSKSELEEITEQENRKKVE